MSPEKRCIALRFVYNWDMNEKTERFASTQQYKKAYAYIREHGLITSGQNVLAALSGGADSVFLLYVLLVLREEKDIAVTAFHLNHMIRGEEAERDEAFCRRLCEENAVPFECARRDIPALAAEKGISTETAGREERYRFFRGWKDRGPVMTAHHMDDNAETVLMHLIRGTGADGLTGIPPVRDGYICRPLLCLTKDEIVSALTECGISWVTDSTNGENEYLRNRVRNVILPLLKEENPSFSRAALRLSEVMNDYVFMAEASADSVKLSFDGENVTVPYEDALGLLPPALWQLVKKAARLLGEGNDLTYESIRDLAGLMGRKRSTVWSLDLHGIRVSRSYGDLLFSSAGRASLTESFEKSFTPGETVEFPHLGFKVVTSVVKKMEKNNTGSSVTFVDCAKIKGTALLRGRREGDRLRPIGMDGTKSVKRLFIDRKVPKEERDRKVLLCDGDTVAAVIGMETDRAYRVDENTADILRLEIINM